MNSVPGVMQLESNGSSSGSVDGSLTLRRFSAASWAVRNRRLRCWLILARGATPSTAMKNSLHGLILAKMNSM